MTWSADILADIRESGLYRRMPRIDGPPDPYVTVDGSRVMLLCSNNYLGIATHPKLMNAAVDAARTTGTSAGASRLVSGNLTMYDELETTLAAFEHRESALVFSCGYMANIALMTTLVDEGDVIFSDALNHASIVDGCRLSRARTIVFAHSDVDDLEKKMEAAGPFRRGLLIVEGVYSLDGDIAPLDSIIEVAETHGIMTVVDEAHGTGVHGAEGRGACERFGVEPDVVMGTFGKALGSAGSFAVCTKELRELLVNRARTLIYTTGLPPATLAAATTAIDVVNSEPDRRRHLLDICEYMRKKLREMGYEVPDGDSQIVPVIVGENQRTVDLSRKLFEKRMFVQAIRPPSVPEGTSRLRVTPMATHTKHDIDLAIDAFRSAGREMEII